MNLTPQSIVSGVQQANYIQCIKSYLLKRFPSTSCDGIKCREYMVKVCCQHIQRNLADVNFIGEFCSADSSRFYQRLSEALLENELLKVGLDIKHSHGGGPDFLLNTNDRRIWIEVICPEPNGIHQDWIKGQIGKVVNFPHQEILLRWTAAIKEKAEKLLGNPGKEIQGYIDKKIVDKQDCYIIAINGCLLRGAFPSITGISQYPFAVEAAFSVGPIKLVIDKEKNKIIDTGYQYRPGIKNKNDANVPADTFFDPKFDPVSAIWAIDLDGTDVVGNPKPSAVIHNPHAIQPVPLGLLPAQDEYIATCIESNRYKLKQCPGRLRPVQSS